MEATKEVQNEGKPDAMKVSGVIDVNDYFRQYFYDARSDRLELVIERNLNKFREDLSSKIDGVKNDLHGEIVGLDKKIDSVKNDLHTEILDVKSDLHGEIVALDKKIDSVENKLHTEILGVKNDLHAEIDALDRKLDKKIDNVENKLHTEIVALDKKIDSVENKLHGEILDVKSDVKALDVRLSGLQNSMSWNFTILAILVTLIGVLLAFAPQIWNFFGKFG